MKVYLNRLRKIGPWGGGAHWSNAFIDHAEEFGMAVVDNKTLPDVILLGGLDADSDGVSAELAAQYKRLYPHVKLILRVNDNDVRKGTTGVDFRIMKIIEACDGVVFVSEWLRDYFKGRYNFVHFDTCVIHNGVDSNIFKPSDTHRDYTSIVAHHWSDNPLKGADIYEQLDAFVGRKDQFSFTYIGRHKCNFKHTRIVSPLYGIELGRELASHDIYVSASRFDPAPNHIIESEACGLPTFVHIDGGGAIELSRSLNNVYASWAELEKRLIERNVPELPDFERRSWKQCIAEYNSFIQKVCYL